MATTSRFELRRERNLVELWLDIRLPFEPKGEVKDARDELRAAIRNMRPRSDLEFVAEYVSADRGFFDLENVLLYNVGTGAFSEMTQRALRCIRSYRPPPPSPTGRTYVHYQRYFLDQRNTGPFSGAILRFKIPTLSAEMKPHPVWWEASAGEFDGNVQIESTFSLVVELPETQKSLATIVKPLLDGIICAMHPASNVDSTAIQRLIATTGWDSRAVIQRLRNPSAAVLQPRQVLHTYGKSVKWDPADELCEEFALVKHPDINKCQVYVRSLDASREIEN